MTAGVDWWCTRCGGRAYFNRETLDPRHPLVHCRDCKTTGAGADTFAAAASAAQLIHDRSHGLDCPAWCPRSDGGEPIAPLESRTEART